MVQNEADYALKPDAQEDSDVGRKLLTGVRLEMPLEEAQMKHLKIDEEIDTKKEVETFLRDMPLTKDVTCGFWIFKGAYMQRLANQNTYVLLYGLVGCVFGMTSSYFNGTLTTLEKRFKIPSKNLGLIGMGNNLSQMITSAVLSYYASKGHRPRWIGFGIMTIVAFCWLTASPHFLYGPGQDALDLTSEFGGMVNENSTLEVLEEHRAKSLCRDRSNTTVCQLEDGNLAPQLVFFLAEVVAGVGSALYYTLGISYMDDNTKKSQTPVLLSFSYFFHMLGPAIGYALASFCMRLYIAPYLHPLISDSDPRWMGAWWLGWLFFGAVLFMFGILFTMLPKELPRAKARRLLLERKRKEANEELKTAEASFSDMLATFKRLLMNKTYVYNTVSSIFYFFGYMPYWIFTPKYIEIQYRQSAATSSMVTGTVALGFSALGVLLSGLFITKYKPSARYMAAWNVIVGLITVVGCMAYAFIGCPGNEQSIIVNIPKGNLSNNATCNSACYCDYVPFSPVCGENNMTYISPCHAGCIEEISKQDGEKIYADCSCIPQTNKTSFAKFLLPDHLNKTEVKPFNSNGILLSTTTTPTTATYSSFSASNTQSSIGGQAIPGACPVNCYTHFVLFLAVMCCLKFFGATGRTSNFLVSVRCIPEQDKTTAMGFGMMTACMFCFIPSPIFFGWLMDSLCIVWGKTCSNTGNCWLYDSLALRYILNFTAATFIFIGTAFDGGVWYLVKDLKIFDDEDAKETEKKVPKDEDLNLFEGKD